MKYWQRAPDSRGLSRSSRIEYPSRRPARLHASRVGVDIERDAVADARLDQYRTSFRGSAGPGTAVDDAGTLQPAWSMTCHS